MAEDFFSIGEDCYLVRFEDVKLGIKIRKKSDDGIGAIVSESALSRDKPVIGDVIVILAGMQVELEPFVAIVRMIKETSRPLIIGFRAHVDPSISRGYTRDSRERFEVQSLGSLDRGSCKRARHDCILLPDDSSPGGVLKFIDNVSDMGRNNVLPKEKQKRNATKDIACSEGVDVDIVVDDPLLTAESATRYPQEWSPLFIGDAHSVLSTEAQRELTHSTPDMTIRIGRSDVDCERLRDTFQRSIYRGGNDDEKLDVSVVFKNRMISHGNRNSTLRHTSRLFVCEQPDCGYTTAKKSNLLAHVRRHTGEQPFECKMPECTYATAHKKSLNAHMRRHTGGRPFACEEPGCGYTARVLGTLKRHMYRHTGERPFACKEPNCKYTTAWRGNLEGHLSSHTGERRFACEEPGCGYTTTSRRNLEAHVYSHTGQRPFACDQPGCVFATRRKDHLTTHMRSHNEEQSFVCEEPECIYTTNQKGNFDRHMRNHNSGRCFECEEPDCGFTTEIKKMFRKHKRWHAKERSFPCEELDCGFTTAKKNVHASHMRSHAWRSTVEAMENERKEAEFLRAKKKDEEQERLLREARERFLQRSAGQRAESDVNSKAEFEQRATSTPSAQQQHWRFADPSRCLDLPKGSSVDEIKKQYRRLCLVYHPDKSKDPHAAEAFVAITNAYRQLTGLIE